MANSLALQAAREIWTSPILKGSMKLWSDKQKRQMPQNTHVKNETENEIWKKKKHCASDNC